MKTFSLFFFLHSVLVTLLVNYLDAYHEVPPSRHIEVVEFGTYLFGIEEDFGDDPIVRCSYTTDTGINDSFVVGFPLVNQRAAEVALYNSSGDHETKLYYNVIKHLGDQGLCQISISNVNETGPANWTLTATVDEGNNEDKNLTDFVFTVKFFYKANIISYTVELLELSSFYNHLIFAEGTNLTSCRLKLGEADYDFILNVHTAEAPTVSSSPSEHDEELIERMKSLGWGLCGLTFENITREGIWPEKWMLSAGDDQGKFHRATFSTRVQESGGLGHHARTAVMGTEFTLQCGQPITQKFCVLFNPDKVEVHTDDCKYTILSVSESHLGIWSCYSGNSLALESIEYTLELVGKGPEYIETWTNDTAQQAQIGCRVGNHRGTTVEHCRMVAPNNSTFNVKIGVATDRYISMGSDFNAGICSLKITKPLWDFEKGKWRCELTLPYRAPLGGYISVAVTPPPPGDTTPLAVLTVVGKPFQIQCQVPYSSEYCHIRAPDGVIYSGHSKEEVTLGKCSLTVEVANFTHNGTWTCSFGREVGIPDEELPVEVTVSELLSYPRSIEVDDDDSAVLICKSGGYPLLFCRFYSPMGDAYHVHNLQNSSSLSYYGKGLEYGECGITIAKVDRSHQGYWTCTTRLFRDGDDPEISGKILLNVVPYLKDGIPEDSSTNIAGIGIGIAVGVVVVTSILGVIAMKRWRRRGHGEVEGASSERRETRDSDTSSNNSETVISRGPAPRSYTNPQPVAVDVEDENHDHQL